MLMWKQSILVILNSKIVEEGITKNCLESYIYNIFCQERRKLNLCKQFAQL